jgi:signal transduction histidine kinase
MSHSSSVMEPAPNQMHGLLDAERLRIARELHDVMSFSFATINVQAGVAAHGVDQRPEQALDALRAIKAISGEASRELRGILGLLRVAGQGEVPSHGVARLDALAATTSSAGLPTRVVISGRADRATPAVDAAAYRIVQEALTNALRHAGPASASVFVTCEPERLVVEVLDDGCGLSAHAHERSPGSGQGIAGMRERAQALGGTLDAGPRRQGGFRVRASLPFRGLS